MTGFIYERDRIGAVSRVQEALTAPPPPADAEMFDAAHDVQIYIDNAFAAPSMEAELYEERIEEIAALGGPRLPNPIWGKIPQALPAEQRAFLDSAGEGASGGRFEATRQEQRDWFERQVEDFRVSLGVDGNMVQTRAQMEQRLAARSHEMVAREEELLAAGGNPWMAFAGRGVGALTDPAIMATMGLGAPAATGARAGWAILRTGIIEAIIGGTTQAAMEPAVQAYREELGLPHGMDIALQNVLGAAAGGGGGGVVFSTLFRGLGAGTAKVMKLGAEVNAMTPREVLEAAKREIKDPTREQKQAMAEAEAVLDIVESAPGGKDPAAVAAHAERVLEETRRAEEGLPARPDLEDAESVEAAAARAVIDLDDETAEKNLDGLLYSLRPEEIEVDAKTFQYKEGGDAEGVVDTLKGAVEWDPMKAGLVIVYEYADGRRVIADGHQRLGLARRIQAADPGQEIKLYGFVLREADGVSPREARIVAGVKNLAEQDARPNLDLEAAKLIREIGPEGFEEIKRTLPLTNTRIRMARQAGALSDEAFDMIRHGFVPLHYGAVIGRLVPDDPAVQLAIMKELARSAPENLTQAEAMVRLALEAGATRETQIDLLGETEVANLLLGARAKVLDRALKALRKDQAVFSTLVAEEGRITAGGNKLVTEQNRTKAEVNAQAAQTLLTLANRKGPISDELTRLARGADAGGNYAAAGRDFADFIRRDLGGGELAGDSAGDGLRAAREPEGSQAESAASAIDRERDPGDAELESFAEPGGAGQAAQLENLELEIRELLERIRKHGPKAAPADSARVNELAARQAGIEVEEGSRALEEIVNPINRTAAAGDQAAALAELTAENLPILEDIARQIEGRTGAPSKVNVKDPAKIVEKGARPEILAAKPWHTVAHIRDSLRFKTVIGSFEDIAAAVAVLREQGVTFVKVDMAKLVAPKEWGWRFVAFDLRMKNGQLVEFYLPLRELEAAKKAGGHELFEKWRNVDLAERDARLSEWLADARASYEKYDAAYSAALERLGLEPSAAADSLSRLLSSEGSSTRSKLAARSSADGEPVRDQAPEASRSEPAPSADSSATRPVERSMSAKGSMPDNIAVDEAEFNGPEGRSALGEAAIERTAEGEQRVLPGAERISDRELAERQGARPLTAGAEQRGVDGLGLFDPDSRAQAEGLFDAVPVGERIDPETGALVAETRGVDELLEEIDAEREFLESAELCKR
jgi:hypothetical protein